jgi:hypothetical protein
MHRVKIAALNYNYYYIVINNVLGYNEKPMEDVTEWLTEEGDAPLFLKGKEMDEKNVIERIICDSGTVTYMKLLHKEKTHVDIACIASR